METEKKEQDKFPQNAYLLSGRECSAKLSERYLSTFSEQCDICFGLCAVFVQVSRRYLLAIIYLHPVYLCLIPLVSKKHRSAGSRRFPLQSILYLVGCPPCQSFVYHFLFCMSPRLLGPSPCFCYTVETT